MLNKDISVALFGLDFERSSVMGVKFRKTSSNDKHFVVYVDGLRFGFLTDNGFLNIPQDDGGQTISPIDLVYIAKKADEVMKYKKAIPKCSCGGTPNFPNAVCSPSEGSIVCQCEIHPFSIRYFGRL